MEGMIMFPATTAIEHNFFWPHFHADRSIALLSIDNVAAVAEQLPEIIVQENVFWKQPVESVLILKLQDCTLLQTRKFASMSTQNQWPRMALEVYQLIMVHGIMI